MTYFSVSCTLNLEAFFLLGGDSFLLCVLRVFSHRIYVRRTSVSRGYRKNLFL